MPATDYSFIRIGVGEGQDYQGHEHGQVVKVTPEELAQVTADGALGWQFAPGADFGDVPTLGKPIKPKKSAEPKP